MNPNAIVSISRLVNLLIPGGGLILIGAEAIGVAVALLFAVAANAVLGSSLLFPDALTPAWRGLAIGVTLGTYLGAQIRFAQTVRQQQLRSADQQRRMALRDARQALLDDRVQDARNALQPVVDRADDDLPLAYRLAQVLTACGEQVAARAAWRRVRRLDHHKIYRSEVEAAEQTLSRPPPPSNRPNLPESGNA